MMTGNDRLLGFQIRYPFDCLFGIEINRFGPFDELEQGDVLLSGFDVSDIGLRAAQPLGEIDLAQPRIDTALDQKRKQRFVPPRIQGAAHSVTRSKDVLVIADDVITRRAFYLYVLNDGLNFISTHAEAHLMVLIFEDKQ